MACEYWLTHPLCVCCRALSVWTAICPESASTTSFVDAFAEGRTRTMTVTLAVRVAALVLSSRLLLPLVEDMVAVV